MTSPRGAPIAIFHPTFRGLGGAEILVATQAVALSKAGVDVCVVTLDFDEDTWRPWFGRIPVRVVDRLSLAERFAGKLTRLEHIRRLGERCFADRRVVLAGNAPCQALIGASSLVNTHRAWYCNEPPRDLHLPETNPTLHAHAIRKQRTSSDAERDYRKRLRENRWRRRLPGGDALAAWDIEQTRKLDRIHCISEFSRDNARRIYGRGDLDVLPPIVRFPEVRAARTGLRGRGLKILTHSRLETPKNVDNVLRGFAIFARRSPDAELHVVGEGTHRERLEQLARSLGIDGATRFHGYLSDAALGQMYDVCDVFALQPLDEPFGMVFPEAAARGLLLVGPDHGGPFEIMDGGRLGFACDPFDPEPLAEAFERIRSMSNAEVDARRTRADEACRGRYSEAMVSPRLQRVAAG